MATQQIIEIDINKIFPNPAQPRKEFNKEKLQELADNIKEYGQQNPIHARKKGEKYELVSGERRWRACKLAGLKKVKAIVDEFDDKFRDIHSLVENFHRENLGEDEKYHAFKNIMKTQKIDNPYALAKLLKISPTTIKKVFEVYDLRKELSPEARKVSSAVIAETLYLPKEDSKKLVEYASKKGLGHRRVRVLASQVKNLQSDVKDTMFRDEITPEQAGDISKFDNTEVRKKAIQEHKNIKMVDKNVERNIKQQQKAVSERVLNKKMIQAKNIITTFRGTSVECEKMINRTIKSLMLCTPFFNIMDDEQSEKTKHYIELWLLALSNASRMAEQIKEKLK